MSTMTLAKADPKALEQERAELQVQTVAPLVAQAQAIEVSDSASAEAATAFLGDCAKAGKLIEARRKELKAPITEAGKRIDALFKELAAPIEAALGTVKPKVLAYRKMEQDRIDAANAERERREREQREAAEAERRAAEDKARQEREAAAREAARLESEARRSKDAEAQERAAAARRAEEQARLRERVAAESQPVTQEVVREEQSSTIKTASGAAISRKTWKFDVMDTEQIPRRFLKVDETAIRQAVRDGERQIPGVRIYESEELAIRA